MCMSENITRTKWARERQLKFDVPGGAILIYFDLINPRGAVFSSNLKVPAAVILTDHQAIPSSCAASPQSSGLRPGSSLSQPGTGVLGMGQVALPSGSGANSNGPLSHSSSCEPGYWDRYAQS